MNENYHMKSLKSAAKLMNNKTFTNYFYRLMLLAQSVFEWENLPNSMDERWIEKYLFHHGKCVFFEDFEKGLMVAKVAESGKLNYYDEPTIVRPVATNYTGKSLENYKQAIIIRNNDIMLPTAHTIELYAYRLAEIERTIDINVHGQRTPVLIVCSDKQKLSMKNVYNQWNEFEPVIYGDKNLDIEGIKVLKTDAPIVFDKLQIHKHSIWNECMTFLGINNANQDKRERLVADEVAANDNQIEMSAQVMLKTRERACKLINELFGTNISVRIRNYEEVMEKVTEEVEKDGSEVHS